MMAVTKEDVLMRLQEVVDPCSAATRSPCRSSRWAWLRTCTLRRVKVTVALRMTSPLCHALPYFEMEIERVLGGAPGIASIKCTFDHGGNWQPDDMTAGAQRKLADQRDLVSNKAAALDRIATVRMHRIRPAGVAL